MFIGIADAKAEALIVWPSNVKSQLIGKDPDAGKNWRQKQKGEVEDETIDSITILMDLKLSNSRK